jgi:hypothetical protein
VRHAAEVLTRIGENAMRWPKLGFGGGERSLDFAFYANIATDAQRCGRATRLRFAGNDSRPFSVEIYYGDSGVPLGTKQYDGAADARPPARHQYRPILQE